MNLDPKQLLEDIKELITVPDLCGALFHKVEELKGIYRDHIDYYKEIGLIEAKTSPPPFDGQPFEIFKRGKQWETKIDIPQVIVDFIVNSDLKPGIPMMERRREFPGLPGKYTITIEMINSNSIKGMIQVEKEKGKEKAATTATAPPGNHLRILQPDSEKDELREFLYFLTTNEELYKHVMIEFRLRWKPTLISTAK
jgi:hypothetical protein